MARTGVHVLQSAAPAAYSEMLARGFRRFGRMVFRPLCQGCWQCIPIRVPIATFQPSRSQRRVLRLNADVRLEVGPPTVDAERLELLAAFHRERSETVGWEQQTTTEADYRETWVDNPVPTLEFRYRLGTRLVALAYVDANPVVFSSIYGFWHPEFRARSLGTYDVLQELAWARERGAHWLYLGFWVPGNRSMNYKTAFRPAEIRVQGAWRPLSREEISTGFTCPEPAHRDPLP